MLTEKKTGQPFTLDDWKAKAKDGKVRYTFDQDGKMTMSFVRDAAESESLTRVLAQGVFSVGVASLIDMIERKNSGGDDDQRS